LKTPNKHHYQEALALGSLIDDKKKLGDCQFDI
jgi:serine/threonine protein phosphatase PrpC